MNSRTIKINFSGFWSGFGEKSTIYKKIVAALEKQGEVIVADNPDYLFCSCFSDDYVDFDGIRIFYSGENLCPDFNSFDYAIGCDPLLFGDRYLKYNIYNLYEKECLLMQEKHLAADIFYREKTDFCSFVVSKPSGLMASGAREDFFRELCKYKTVNSGGRYLNNIGQPNGVKDKLEFQRKHKFSICFENSVHPGYSTEKLVEGFAAGTVPIYWGDPMIGETFNKKAFVDCNDYNSFSEVIDAIQKIDLDDGLYLSVLREPALVRSNQITVNNNSLEAFLKNIVVQRYEKAFRRNRVITTLENEQIIKQIRRDQKKISWKIWKKFDHLMQKEKAVK